MVGDAQIANVGEFGDPGGEGDGGADGFCAVDAVAHGAVCALCDLSAVFSEGFCLAEGDVDAAEKTTVAGEIVQELGDELEIDGVGELMGGFVLELVCLIDDDAVVFWQQAADLEILEEQGMVGDDDARLFTGTFAAKIAAFAVVWAATAETGGPASWRCFASTDSRLC